MKRLLIGLTALGSLAACDATSSTRYATPTAADLAVGRGCPGPTIESTAYLTPRNPTEAIGLVSTYRDGDPLVQIEFANATCSVAYVFWIDYDGELVLYKRLRPGQSYFQESYTGHPWLVTRSDLVTGLALFGPTSTSGAAVIKDDNRRELPLPNIADPDKHRPTGLPTPPMGRSPWI